jgi:hypothetical protein
MFRTFRNSAFAVHFSMLSTILAQQPGNTVSPVSTMSTHIEKIMGVKGEIQEGVLVQRFPRSDLKIMVGSEQIPAALGFSSWAAWKEVGRSVLVMGDFVLTGNEINPFIAALQNSELRVTALRNHFIREQPMIYSMHIGGKGGPQSLASTLGAALRKTATPLSPKPSGTPPPKLDASRIAQIVGISGKFGGGVYKITAGRSGVKEGGIEIPPAMGLNSWAGFIGTNEKAHVAGDIAMTSSEVEKIIKSLRAGGVEIGAVHNRMLDEQPRIFFLYYWGSGKAEDLAKTIRSAFDIVKRPAA